MCSHSLPRSAPLSHSYAKTAHLEPSTDKLSMSSRTKPLPRIFTHVLHTATFLGVGHFWYNNLLGEDWSAIDSLYFGM